MIAELAHQMGATSFAARRLEAAQAVGRVSREENLSQAACPETGLDARDVVRSGRPAFRALLSRDGAFRHAVFFLFFASVGIAALTTGLHGFKDDLFHVFFLALGAVALAAPVAAVAVSAVYGSISFANEGAVRALATAGMYLDGDVLWVSGVDGSGGNEVRKIYLDALGDVVLRNDDDGCTTLVLKARDGEDLALLREPTDGHGTPAWQIAEVIESARGRALGRRI